MVFSPLFATPNHDNANANANANIPACPPPIYTRVSHVQQAIGGWFLLERVMATTLAYNQQF